MNFVFSFVGFPVLKSLGVAGDVSEAGNTLNFTLVTDMVGLASSQVK